MRDTPRVKHLFLGAFRLACNTELGFNLEFLCLSGQFLIITNNYFQLYPVSVL